MRMWTGHASSHSSDYVSVMKFGDEERAARFLKRLNVKYDDLADELGNRVGCESNRTYIIREGSTIKFYGYANFEFSGEISEIFREFGAKDVETSDEEEGGGDVQAFVARIPVGETARDRRATLSSVTLVEPVLKKLSDGATLVRLVKKTGGKRFLELTYVGPNICYFNYKDEAWPRENPFYEDDLNEVYRRLGMDAKPLRTFSVDRPSR